MSYLKPEEHYFSPGFRNLIVAIYPHKAKKEAHFPFGCHQTRCSGQETIHEWFCRIIDTQLEGAVEKCAVETNMGVFAHLRYDEASIAYANIQVLVAEADLETYYIDSRTRCSYFRFDYDLGCLGEIFKEPHPHIHSAPEGAPRFGPPIQHGNAVLDFFDFIYRNFHHEKWIEWARFAYDREGPFFGREEDIFEPIEAAFKANKHQELVSVYSKPLGHMKAACRSLKDKLFTGRIDLATAATIAYDSVPQ